MKEEKSIWLNDELLFRLSGIVIVDVLERRHRRRRRRNTALMARARAPSLSLTADVLILSCRSKDLFDLSGWWRCDLWDGGGHQRHEKRLIHSRRVVGWPHKPGRRVPSQRLAPFADPWVGSCTPCIQRQAERIRSSKAPNAAASTMPAPSTIARPAAPSKRQLRSHDREPSVTDSDRGNALLPMTTRRPCPHR